MRTKIYELVSEQGNWGKFLVGRFDEAETGVPSQVEPRPVLNSCGWGDGSGYLLVVDLQTGEGAIFRPGGWPVADLRKHQIWVCPMFGIFLETLYAVIAADPDWFEGTTRLMRGGPEIDLELSGYRRPGPAMDLVRQLAEGGDVRKLRREARRLVAADGPLAEDWKMRPGTAVIDAVS